MAAPIPGGGAEFNPWVDNFVTYAGANLANLGVHACREGIHGTNDITDWCVAKSTGSSPAKAFLLTSNVTHNML